MELSSRENLSVGFRGILASGSRGSVGTPKKIGFKVNTILQTNISIGFLKRVEQTVVYQRLFSSCGSVRWWYPP